MTVSFDHGSPKQDLLTDCDRRPLCLCFSSLSLYTFAHEEHVVLSHLFYAVWDELLLPFRLDALSLSDSHAIQYDRQRLTDVKTAQNFLHPGFPDVSTARHIECWHNLFLRWSSHLMFRHHLSYV
jgi:hypothetical protein